MKWVKVAIGAVIAISVVPIIALSVFNLTQEKVREEVVSFTLNVIADTYTPINAFDDIILYGNENVIGYFDNIIEIKYNNIVTNDYRLGVSDPNNITIASISLDGFDIIDIDGNYIIVDGIFSNNDTLEITFEVTTPPVLSGVTATLLALTPLIFVGGVLSYFLVKTNLKKED